MQLSDFQYDLPSELIARYPLPTRSASRLLCLDGTNGAIAHRQFTDLLTLLTPDDLLVLNDTRVIPARLLGMKETGGQVEVLVDRILDKKRIVAQVRASKPPRLQSNLYFANHTIRFEICGRKNDFYELYCHAEQPVFEVVETIGHTPLPPYFQRAPEESDKERYQTVFAEYKGSVAAPTAGLHFDTPLLTQLQRKGVQLAYLTLHVGAGTFAPVRVENITEHTMHAEAIHVSAHLCEQIKKTKARGGRIVAVGTTTLRSLETASRTGTIMPYSGETDIFIYPGFTFQCVDVLVTNFHTSGSTLLMLVAAFAGYQNTMAAYQEAVRLAYRFFSYGDAMFLTRAPNG
jgi:S-adenosylmethionine:tRNA ribosyltransferase-isomerase